MSDNYSGDTRISKVEDRLVELTEAAVMVARIDERYKALEVRHDKLAATVAGLQTKIDKLEDAVNLNTRVIMTITKLFWVIIIAASTALAAQFFA